MILGVGTGAYREEYEALFPDATGAQRGEIVDEGMRALRLLFTERKATFRGRARALRGRRVLPQAAPDAAADVRGRQPPGGPAPRGRVRRGLDAGGAVAGGDRRGVEDVQRAAARAGRDGVANRHRAAVRRAPSAARTTRRVRRFHGSQLYKHLESLKRSTLREQTGGFEQRNLIGSPAEICERIRVYQQAGVTTLSGLLFVANTVPEMQEAIDLFGREVIPHFR